MKVRVTPKKYRYTPQNLLILVTNADRVLVWCKGSPRFLPFLHQDGISLCPTSEPHDDEEINQRDKATITNTHTHIFSPLPPPKKGMTSISTPNCYRHSDVDTWHSADDEEDEDVRILAESQPMSVDVPEDHLLTLHDHDCLLVVLSFLSWKDLNNFSTVSKSCHEVRNHAFLDQTRSGTIFLGSGVSTAKEFLDKVRTERWSDAFCGHRTHLRLFNLTYLSSNIEPINDEYLNTIAPLKNVKSLDCSMTPRFRQCCYDDYDERTSEWIRKSRRSWFLAPFEDYVDKGLAQGVTLSMLVPNLRSIDMSYLPFTTVGIAMLARNNPNLEVIRWNRSLIWPISNESEGHFEALGGLKELYLDEARMILCANLDEERLWNTLLSHAQKLTRVSLLGTRWYRKGQLAASSQDYLVDFVRRSPNLVWFRSDLTLGNVDMLRKERPDICFVSMQGEVPHC